MATNNNPGTTLFGRLAPALALAAVMALPVAVNVEAQQAQQQSERKTRKTPALREKVYKDLTEAQALGEAEDFAGALRILDKLQRQDDLNSYEKAQLYNFYAFIYYQQDRLRDAIRAYENVRSQPDIPEAMELQAIYALGQLYFTVEDYDKTISLLEQWFNHPSSSNPGPQPYVFLSQAYYQKQQYGRALPPLDKAMAIARERGMDIKENWLLLKRVYHYELKQYDEVAAVLTQLIQRFPKREYWNQLSSVYGELGQNDKQLAVLELASLQGYLDRSQDLRNLAQLYMLNGDPFRGAKTLEKAMDDGIVEKNLANYRLLSQAWAAAREDKKALPVLRQAAALSSDGTLDLRIAYSEMNLSNYEAAANAAREAIRKGGLRNTSEAHELLGTALFNMDRLNDAEQAFRSADSRRAQQWINHIDKERARRAELARVKELGRQQELEYERKLQEQEEAVEELTSDAATGD